MDSQKVSNGGDYRDTFVDGIKQFLCVIPITALTIPFNVAYTQLTGEIITQGMAMAPSGFLDAPMINNCVALSVLVFGFLYDTCINPCLIRRGIHVSICHKFAIGSFCGFLSIWPRPLSSLQGSTPTSHGDNCSVSDGKSLCIFPWEPVRSLSMPWRTKRPLRLHRKNRRDMASAFNLFLVGSVRSCRPVSIYFLITCTS